MHKDIALRQIVFYQAYDLLTFAAQLVLLTIYLWHLSCGAGNLMRVQRTNNVVACKSKAHYKLNKTDATVYKSGFEMTRDSPF